MKPVKQHATMADLEALPEPLTGEIIDGALYVLPSLRPWHSHTILRVLSAVARTYHDKRGGLGGWWILYRPGIAAPGAPEFVPDVAGWRTERLPSLPDTRIDIAPDWVCEVQTREKRHHDYRIKRPFYARIGVKHLWYVDLDARSVFVRRLEEGRWVDAGVFVDDDVLQAEPFPDVEIALADWWPPLPPEDAPSTK